MPSLAMYKISPPSDSAEFEVICKDYLQKRFDADTTLYGRKGQSQFGIDIIVTLNDFCFICAQCKNVKTVSTTQLDKWIEKAETCKIAFKEFVIIVAIERDTSLQTYICNLTTQRKKKNLFPVRLIFWDDIADYIKRDEQMLKLHYHMLYNSEEDKIAEAILRPEKKYPEMIQNEELLRQLFFKEAVKYSIEEFLNCDITNGVSIELVTNADIFIDVIQKLLYRSPMLNSSSVFYDIQKFLVSINHYSEYITSISETNGEITIATNKYHTKKEENDIQRAQKKCLETLGLFNEMKNY